MFSARKFSPGIAAVSVLWFSLLAACAENTAVIQAQQQQCTFCRNGGTSQAELADKVIEVPGFGNRTCAQLESFAERVSTSNENCASLQSLGSLCGCVSANPQGSNNNNSSSTDAAVMASSPQANISMPSCSVCRDGSQISNVLADKPLDLGSTIPVRNCRELVALASFLDANADECKEMQILGTYCGCPSPVGSCTVCANGEPMLYPSRGLNWFDDYAFYRDDTFPESLRVLGGKNFSCDMMQSAIDAINVQGEFRGLGSDAMCLIAQLKSPICGCQPSRLALFTLWSYRIAAILSLLGSSLILYDILSRHGKTSSTYHQLIIGISCFDLISSTPYALAGLLFPKSSGLYAARGNDSTCKLQGFMIQLGLTSMYYNMVLSMYYVLVVKYNWKEFRFQKYRRFVHAALIVLGLVMAFAAFPFYGETNGVCYVVSAPRAENEIPITIFFTVPLSLALVFITAANFEVCRTVYKQEKRGAKWRLGGKEKLKMSRKVAYMSLFYAASFYVTIPLAVAAYYIELGTARRYSLVLGVSALSALQGFLNAWVYFYRRGIFVLVFGKCRSLWKGYCRRRRAEPKPDGAHGVDENAANNNNDYSPQRETEQETNHNDEEASPEIEQSGIASASPLPDLTIDQVTVPEEVHAGHDAEGDDTCSCSEDHMCDAAAEHWLATQDDGHLSLPSFRRLPKRLSALGAAFRHSRGSIQELQEEPEVHQT